VLALSHAPPSARGLGTGRRLLHLRSNSEKYETGSEVYELDRDTLDECVATELIVLPNGERSDLVVAGLDPEEASPDTAMRSGLGLVFEEREAL